MVVRRFLVRGVDKRNFREFAVAIGTVGLEDAGVLWDWKGRFGTRFIRLMQSYGRWREY